MTDTMATAETAATDDDRASIRDAANKVINRHALYGGIGGLMPVPALDLAVVVGVQVKMIAELAEVYGTPFSGQSVKAYVGALLGGGLPVSGVSGAIGSAMKAIPGIGTLIGMFAVPGVAFAATWGVGKVFAWHFEQGGTLANFNVDSAREKFKKEFERFRGGKKPAPEQAAA